MALEGLHFNDAGPFEEITFEFDPRVNVFVGPNNSGKSTALMALAEMTVFPFAFPQKIRRADDILLEISFSGVTQRRRLGKSSSEDFIQWVQLGGTLSQIGYSAFVPALRMSTDYRSQGPTVIHATYEDSLDEETRRSLEPAEIDTTEIRKRMALISTDAHLVSDEAIIKRMIDLDYTSYRRNQPHIRQLVDKVVTTASEITEGFPVEFLGVDEDGRGLFPKFRTPDGDVPLNVLSQGTQSVMQWLAHFLFNYAQYYDYPEDLTERSGVLIVDEIDAHLHPSWQRRIIPVLISNFPNLQIFCSTHSPLMLARLGEGQVQLLNRDADGRVTVSRNRWDMAGWSSEEILRSVLGLTDTIDLATASEIDRMGELSIKEALTDDEATELEGIRSRVEQGLLDGPPSSQVESFRRFVKEVYSRQASGSGSSGRTRPRVRRKENGSS